MKKINRTVIIILAALATTAFLILINDIVISIRLNELRSGLQDMDRREGSIDNIGLVATYEIHKKLFENRISQEEADDIEQRINSLSILKKETPPRLNAIYSIISFPALAVINFNRRILGKRPLAYSPGDDSGHATIDLAYYYERNFHFKRAIELYDACLMNASVTTSIRAGVILHKGYCYALLGRNDMARSNYIRVIERYSQESSAITATILLKYLEGFRLASERVLDEKDESLSTGQRLVNLFAYKQALSILKKAELKAKQEDRPGIKYYMARCFAGMGDTDKAVENYLQVITSSPSSRYAIFSNRKLYMTGSSAGDAVIKNTSIELNRIFNDPLLDRMIKNREKIPADKNPNESRVKINISPDLKARIDTIVAEKNTPGLKKSRYLVIFTSDGNIFKGTLIEQTADHIALKTSIGRIDVKKERVIRVTEK